MQLYLLYYVVLSAVAESMPGRSKSDVMPDLDLPYCALRYRRLCQGKGMHVACQYSSPEPGEACVNFTVVKFTKYLRNFITNYINRRRQRLAAGNEKVRGGVYLPKPKIMMQVKWDQELAMLANRLAFQCNFKHDACRATVRFPYAGQTVGEVKWRRTNDSEKLNVAHAIRRVMDAWWGERWRVTVEQLIQPFKLLKKGQSWGHFSQLAVWTLRAVGCAAVTHGDRHQRLLFVCDFSHTNMLGQRTIVPGPLAPCPPQTTRRQRSTYALLCAPAPIRSIESRKHNNVNSELADDPEDDDAYTESEFYIFPNSTTAHEFSERRQIVEAKLHMNNNIEPEETKGKVFNKDTEDNEISQYMDDDYNRKKCNEKSSKNNQFENVVNRDKSEPLNSEDIKYSTVGVPTNDKIETKKSYTIKRIRYKGSGRKTDKLYDTDEDSYVRKKIYQKLLQDDEKWTGDRYQGSKLKQERVAMDDTASELEEYSNKLRADRLTLAERVWPIYKQKLFEADRQIDPENRYMVKGIGEIRKLMENQKTKVGVLKRPQHVYSIMRNASNAHIPIASAILSKQLQENQEYYEYMDELLSRKLTVKENPNEEESARSMVNELTMHRQNQGSAPAHLNEPAASRQRYRPPKERPDRPGAKALARVSDKFPIRSPAIKKVFTAYPPPTMDKEHVDQLFKDTGFSHSPKPDEKKQS